MWCYAEEAPGQTSLRQLEATKQKVGLKLWLKGKLRLYEKNDGSQESYVEDKARLGEGVRQQGQKPR